LVEDKKMLLSFQLTMPNNNAWDGKWSGEGKFYYEFRNIPKSKIAELDGKNFYYNFGDGWGANVRVEKIDSQEKRKLQKKSAGFCGYNWMIDEILNYGRILILEERKIKN